MSTTATAPNPAKAARLRAKRAGEASPKPRRRRGLHDREYELPALEAVGCLACGSRMSTPFLIGEDDLTAGNREGAGAVPIPAAEEGSAA